MSTISYPEKISKAINLIKDNSSQKIIAGCTAIDKIPDAAISIRNIAELKVIEKREMALGFGSVVTLSSILNLGKRNIPDVLFDSIKSIANRNIRNIATIGGNISGRNFRHTLFSPLLALDAKLTYAKPIFTNITYKTQTVPLAKITEMPDEAFLTGIIVPLTEWNYSAFQRFGPSHEINYDSGTFTILAYSESNRLSNIRLAFASSFLFRNADIETKLMGSYLPLEKSLIDETISAISAKFDEECKKKSLSPILRKQFFNQLSFHLSQLK
ncbi:MAG: FAD binding domain-containing protein [Treponema sp.]|nr:FAD binding domain-containing protein [Treponema sp.]